MSRIVWDKTGERFYETGVDRAVLYPISSAGLYNKGVPWNGITGTRRAAQPADVTHVRWAFQKPIPVGGTGKLMFRGVVK